jgi:serine/threonine protein phosphatase 1
MARGLLRAARDRKEAMRLGEARAPDGLRLYAIGDVHGRDDLLATMHERIALDRASRPTPDYRIIHLGDYVDRGPESAAVIERLVKLKAADERAVFLKGNHEELLLDFLNDPVGGGPTFFNNGGLATLASYGLSLDRWFFGNRHMIDAADRLAKLMPPAHRAFLDGLGLSARFGDFFFCHAGIKPGVPLDKQTADDLTWIRGPFLESTQEFEAVVVHGHTPAPEPEVRPNRINIDTGAVFSGVLTCVAIEGTEFRFL